MRISITFPISDSRSLLPKAKTDILDKPGWLSGVNPFANEFVRFFGAIKNKKHAEIGIIPPTCAANHVIRFGGSPEEISEFEPKSKKYKPKKYTPIFDNTDDGLKIDLKIQRWFDFDRHLIGKLEISAINVRRDKKLELNEIQLKAFVDHFLNLQITILNPAYNELEKSEKFIECRLHELGQHLPDLYLKATTHSSKYSFEKNQTLVQVGIPILFLEIQKDENITIPNQWRTVCAFRKIPLFSRKFKLLRGNIRQIPMYVFNQVSGKDFTPSRAMHSFVIQLFIKKQCLDLIVKNLKNNEIKVSKFVEAMKETKYIPEFEASSIPACQNLINDYYQNLDANLDRLSLEELKKIVGDDIFGTFEKCLKEYPNIHKLITDIASIASIFGSLLH